MSIFLLRNTTLAAIFFALQAGGCAAPTVPVKPVVPARPLQRQRPTASAADMRARILAAHNAWRKTVNVPPLQWSERLARYAQNWADTLQGQGCNPEHRPANSYGENIEWASGQRLTPEEVVALWGQEGAFYNHASNSCQTSKNCLHYTQIVWRDTTDVGCGLARCENSEVWVCNYAPPGNWVGKRPY